MIKKGVIPLLALGHGLNDLLAGYYLGSMVQQEQNLLQAGMGLLVYNLLAFGGQYPVALWMEKIRNPKRFLTASYMLNVAALPLFAILPQLSIVLMGAASAIYHVAGGTVCARDNKAVNIGLFAAPGVAGLIAGGYFAWQGYQLLAFLLPTALLFLGLLVLLQIPDADAEKKEVKKSISPLPDRHDMIMILLLTVIALRSAVWNIFQLIYENNYEWLLVIAAAAFAGKIFGGWLADRIGWRLYIFISLFTAMPLVTFFRDEMILFSIGIGLLQSGIPATTALLIHSVNGKTERGVGLSFGTAIIAGAVAFSIPAEFYERSGIIPFAVITLMLLFMFLSGWTKLFRRKPGLPENSRQFDL
jgi:FSR family fosmidomycin resistance protein-like MFS transporter